MSMEALATTTIEPQGAEPRRGRARANRRFLLGSAGLTLIVLVAILAPLIAPFDPIEQHLDDRLLGPTSTYWFGTDNLGRDTFSRLVFGLRPSLIAGVAAVALGAISGTVLGVVAGYLGRVTDAVIGRLIDLLIAWPAIFIALALVVIMGPGPLGVVLAIGLGEMPVFARVARAITLANLGSEHVDAARSMGASGPRIMRRHIFPFAISSLVVQFAIGAPLAVIAEASLSFLGLGTQPPDPSLGQILSNAQLYLSESSSLTVFPVLTVAALVLSLTLLADGLQDMLDPKRQAMEL